MKNLVKVLITSENDELYQNSKELFKKYSLDVVFSPKDGVKLLDIVENIKPKVVVMDIFMHSIDAIGVIKATKKIKMAKRPIFIIISNFKNPDIELEALDLGVSCFMVKPFSIHELAQKILYLTNSKAGQQGYKETNSSLKYSQEYEKNQKSIEIEVTDILHQIGVPAHIKGYHYLRSAIIMSVEKPDIINAVTKQLYPSVAKAFSTTSSRVERAIRHAIEVAWDRGDIEVLNSYFGYTIHTSRGKPTNSEFIAMISDKLRLHLKSAS